MAVSRGTVLLIDDEPFFLRILSDAFDGSGISVFTAGDGLERIRVFPEIHQTSGHSHYCRAAPSAKQKPEDFRVMSSHAFPVAQSSP
jgi:CheY-like chemotaxis protein